MQAAISRRSGTEPTFEWMKENCTIENDQIQYEDIERKKKGRKDHIHHIKDFIKLKATREIYKFYRETFWIDQLKNGALDREELIRKDRKMVLNMYTRMTASLRACFMYVYTRSVCLDVFFAPYTQDTLAKDYTIYNVGDENDFKILKLENKYGIFWFSIFNHCNSKPLGKVELIDEVYEGGKVRPTALFMNPEGHVNQQVQNIVSITRVDPYVCNNCHIYMPFMKKCGKCSRKLGIDVRYCSERCQREDFEIRHKHVCGK